MKHDFCTNKSTLLSVIFGGCFGCSKKVNIDAVTDRLKSTSYKKWLLKSNKMYKNERNLNCVFKKMV